MQRLRIPITLTAILSTGWLGCGDNVTGRECGAGTHEVAGVCVPDSVDPVDPPLEPGRYQAPLVQLQRLQGEEDHMHVAQLKYRESDGMLFFCSYTFGMIDASDPQSMRYRVEGLRHSTPSGSPRTPGCLHLSWDEDDPNIIYTSHRGNIDFARFLSGWDLTDTGAPVQLPALQEPGISYGGIDVEKDTKLRAEVRQSGAHYQVLKNTLAKRVLAGDEYKDLHPQMTGMTGYVFGSGDPVQAAKALTKFAKENEEVFQVKAGYFEGRVLSQDQLKALADTPSKEVLLTRLATALKSPIQRIASVLAAPIQKLAGTLQALADKKKEEGGEG